MICDKCKKEITGFFLLRRRFFKDKILCANCIEEKVKKRGRLRKLNIEKMKKNNHKFSFLIIRFLNSYFH